MREYDCESIVHPIPPFFDEQSEILILGSFPSVRSRETQFYYGHPQNRFWRILSEIYDQPFPENVSDRQAFLKRNHIALWDVIGSCRITGSSDASIRDVKANDIRVVLDIAPIREIYVNGKTAARYYDRYIEPVAGRSATVLPSTSPANAVWSSERLRDAWQVIRR